MEIFFDTKNNVCPMIFESWETKLAWLFLWHCEKTQNCPLNFLVVVHENVKVEVVEKSPKIVNYLVRHTHD